MSRQKHRWICCSRINSMCGSRKFSQGGVLITFFSHQHISQRAVLTSLKKQLDPKGPIASRGGVRTSISEETYFNLDFPGGSGPPVHPSGSVHEFYPLNAHKICFERIISSFEHFVRSDLGPNCLPRLSAVTATK